MSPLSGSEIFAGRESEMAELVAALDDAEAGSGRMVMLVGEPGIGKTRTAEELASISQERGAEVFWGRCPEERGAPVQVWSVEGAERRFQATRIRFELRDDAPPPAQFNRR